MSRTMLVDGEVVEMTDDQAASLPTVAAPVRWMVPKLRAVDRLIAGGHAEAFLAALASNPVAKLRFDAAVEIWSDEPAARTLLSAIGADPDEVLAP